MERKITILDPRRTANDQLISTQKEDGCLETDDHDLIAFNTGKQKRASNSNIYPWSFIKTDSSRVEERYKVKLSGRKTLGTKCL